MVGSGGPPVGPPDDFMEDDVSAAEADFEHGLALVRRGLEVLEGVVACGNILGGSNAYSDESDGDTTGLVACKKPRAIATTRPSWMSRQ